MENNFINNKKKDINEIIRGFKGESLPNNPATLCLLEINSIILNEEPENKMRLKDFLQMFYSDCWLIPQDEFYHEESHNSSWVVKVFPEAENYHLKEDEEEYPLIFKTPFFKKKEYKIKIENLERFLDDYRNQTGTWIGANDIMNAEIVDFEMPGIGQYDPSEIKIRIRID